jgi:hypothetical protein
VRGEDATGNRVRGGCYLERSIAAVHALPESRRIEYWAEAFAGKGADHQGIVG